MRVSSPQANNNYKQIRHGVHYLSRDKQPSMFQILTWKQTNNALDSKDWLIKMSPNYTEGRFTEPPIYQKSQPLHKIQQKQSPPSKDTNLKKHVKWHEIKHNLYYYGDEQQIKAQKQQQQAEAIKMKNKNKLKSPAAVQKKILSQFDEKQKKQILIRKHKIKEFSKSSRQLPNSAFTTYFGKPAFENYGFATNPIQIAARKTHSVMPHAGNNNPNSIQSHQTALNKANVINIQSHVPRNPFQQPHNEDYNVKLNEYYSVQIVKPDLINEQRFSNISNQINFKAKTPRHNEVNKISKRHYKEMRVIASARKNKRQKVRSQQKGDGLAFMNKRQHFMRQVQQKKKNKERLAYKVTQCYPLDWDFKESTTSTQIEDKWNKIRPAGKISKSLSNPSNYIYR